MTARRSILLASLGAVVTAIASSCAAPASRYRTDAMAFIADQTMFDAYGVDFQNIECTEPESTDEGATLTCRADGDDGQSYSFTLTIVATNELELTDIALAADLGAPEAPDSASPESTSPDSASPDSTPDSPDSTPSGPVSVPPTTAVAATTVTAPAPAPAATAAPTTTAAAPTTIAAAPAPTPSPPTTSSG